MKKSTSVTKPVAKAVTKSTVKPTAKPTPPKPAASKPIAKSIAKPVVKPVDTVDDSKAIDLATFNPIEAVAAKYVENKWQVMIMQGTINDIVAKRNDRYHFIQVVPSDKVDDMRYHALAKNSFIQNAFSNNAIPVHALVTIINGRSGARAKITLEDVNAQTRIICGGLKTKNNTVE